MGYQREESKKESKKDGEIKEKGGDGGDIENESVRGRGGRGKGWNYRNNTGKSE